jgi:hypothetical protein
MGSIRSTGPCGEASDSATASRIASRVTGLPPRKVPARPWPSNTQPSAPHTTTACWRDTVGSLITTSLSELRPIRTVWPGAKLNCRPS